MSPPGLGGLFPSLPFKRVEARAGLATALGIDAAGDPVQAHQLFRGSGILKRASLRAVGFKGRSLRFRANRSVHGRLVRRRKDSAFWQGIKFLHYFNTGDLYSASSARGWFP